MRTAFACLVSACVLSSAAAAQTTLRFSNWIPPTHGFVGEIFTPWAQDVAQATGGRVKVELIPPLGPPPAHFDLIRNGVTDVSFSVHSYTTNRFPLSSVGELPLLGSTSLANSLAYWRLTERTAALQDEHRGIKLLGNWVSSATQAFMVRKPINTFGDFAGMKLRVGGGISVEVVKALGAAPFAAPAPQVYEVLSKGVADGALLDVYSIQGFRAAKLLKQALIVPGGLYRATFYLGINPDKWAAISPADQAAIMRVSGEALARRAGTAWDRLDATALEEIKAEKVPVVAASGPLLSAIGQSLQPLEKAWVEAAAKAGVDGAAVLAAYKAELAKN